jgi:putative protease
LPAVVLPLSRLNAVRREFYQELAELLEARQHEARTDHRRQAMADLAPAGTAPVSPPRFAVASSNLHDLSLLKQKGVHELILPLAPGCSNKLGAGGRTAKQTEQILWDLPLVIFDADWSAFQAEIKLLTEAGFKRFRLQNLSQLFLFDGMQGLLLESGYRLFTTNSQAALGWRELGLSGATLYVEDDRENFSALLNRETGLPLTITAYANLPMMTSRIPLKGVKSDQPIVSDRDEAYRVDQRSGLTVVRPEQDFSLIGHLAELHKMGCRRFVVDLSHLGASSAEARRVLAACEQDEPLPGTSNFNYLQEMI